MKFGGADKFRVWSLGVFLQLKGLRPSGLGLS